MRESMDDEDEISRLRRELMQSKAEKDELRKVTANDSDLIMQLSKKLEILLNENET